MYLSTSISLYRQDTCTCTNCIYTLTMYLSTSISLYRQDTCTCTNCIYTLTMYLSTSTSFYRQDTCTCTTEFLITFEAWAKLAQKWLVYAPLRIHLEPIK